MKNKKGMTLIELIVSITLISIVIVFLFQLLVEIKYQNLYDTTKIEYKVASSIVTRKIQNSLMEEKVGSIESCDATDTCLQINFVSTNYLEIKITNNNQVLSIIKRNSSDEIIFEDIRQIPEKDETGYLGEYTDLAYETTYFTPVNSSYDYEYDSLLKVTVNMYDSLNNIYPITVYAPYSGGTEFSSYSLIVLANGGTWSGTTPQNLATGETTTISNPTKSGFAFNGWEVNGEGSSIVGTTFTMGVEDTVLTANWIPTTIVEFAYTGAIQTFTANYTGYYQLEVWGASGGIKVYAGTIYDGYGGYSTGSVYLTANQTIYITIGGQGNTTTSPGTIVAGGYNGGGQGYSYTDSRGGASGGGATHIATTTGLLSSLSSNQSNILIVAGGGGGADQCCAGYTKYAGNGGGYLGTNGVYVSTYAYGGTQSAGGTGSFSGSFGQGANCTSNDCAGGGGGFYGGAANIGGGGYGGGGSSYIANSLLLSHDAVTKLTYCYNCTTSSNPSTLTYSTTNHSSVAVTNYAKSGNGYAKIIYLGSG